MNNLVLFLRRNFKNIGKISYGVNNKIGYITKIDVDKSYRKQGIGTELLNLSETHLKNNYKVNKIVISSWNSIYDNGDVNDFFEKNHYNKIDKKPIIYDDYDNIFEISSLEKII